MPRFIRTEEANLDARDVVLGVKRGDDGKVVGRIVALTITHAGLTPTTTAPDDLPVDEALREAVDLVTSADSDISVVDPEGLWQPSWGTLETR